VPGAGGDGGPGARVRKGAGADASDFPAEFRDALQGYFEAVSDE
jgi:hypothetical protein